MSHSDASRLRDPSARLRLGVSVVVGLLVGIPTSLSPAHWEFGLLIGWMAAAAAFAGWMWATIRPMSAAATRRHACREDPGQATADLVILCSAVASLGGVALVLAGSSSGGAGKILAAAMSVISIGLAWTTVHTVFTTRYARLYYVDSRGGINFHEEAEPRYKDFAYLAFTIGMTFQVSDTDISRQEVRDAILRHMLLSYVLGAVVIATTINLVAGLAK